ncbi:hypothetical protein MMC11_008128 [Xylographa trunciseda]|nr:hypothetical protein [Xylographa trunciseda]
MSTRSQLGNLSLEILEKIAIFMLRDDENLAFFNPLKTFPDLYCRLRTPAIKQELVLKTLLNVPASCTIDQRWFIMREYKSAMVNYFKKEVMSKHESGRLKHNIQYQSSERASFHEMITTAYLKLIPSSDELTESSSRRESRGWTFGSTREEAQSKTSSRQNPSSPSTSSDATPQQLLTGPWPKDKLDFLQLLLEHRETALRWTQDALVAQGLDATVQAGNLRALKTLLPPVVCNNVEASEAISSDPKCALAPPPSERCAHERLS